MKFIDLRIITALLVIVFTLQFSTSLSQKSRPLGLVFLDTKKPFNNSLQLEDDIIEHWQDSFFIHYDFEDSIIYQTEIERLFNQELINHGGISDHDKARYYFKYGMFLSDNYEMESNKIYNFFNYLYLGPYSDSLIQYSRDIGIYEFDFVSKDAVISGGTEVINMFNLAAGFGDESTKRTILIELVDYAINSGLYEYVIHRAVSDSLLENYTGSFYLHDIQKVIILLKESEYTDWYKYILTSINDAFRFTKYAGSKNYATITPGVNAKFDGDFWFGGELALDISTNRFAYRLRTSEKYDGYFRVSLAHVGFNVNMATNLSEWYFGTIRYTHLHIIHLKLVQFGIIRNLTNDLENSWFYRPQIGLAFGNFQLFYSYTHLFKKDLRPMIAKHAINLRMSLPYFRVSRYNF
jgi:hypothetical protein